MIVGPMKPMPRPLIGGGALDPRHLVLHDRLLHRRGAPAAVLLRPQHPDVAGVVQLAVPRLALVERLELLLGRVGLEPAPGRRAKLPVFRRVVQVHRAASAVRAAGRRGAGAPHGRGAAPTKREWTFLARRPARINARGEAVDRGVQHVGDRARSGPGLGDDHQVGLDELAALLLEERAHACRASPASRRCARRRGGGRRCPTWIHGLIRTFWRERLVGLVEKEAGVHPAARAAIERAARRSRARDTRRRAPRRRD